MSFERPLLVPFLGFAAGAVFASFTMFRVPAAALLALFVLVCCAARFTGPWNFMAASVALFFCLGMVSLEPWLKTPVHPGSIAAYAGRNPVTVEGLVCGRPAGRSAGSSLSVQVTAVKRDRHWHRSEGTLLVTVISGDAAVSRGDLIRFPATLTIPRPTGLPGEFDYRKFLALRGIEAAGRVTSAAEIVLIKGAARDSFLRTFDSYAALLQESIRRSIPDQAVSSVLNALLIGDQRRIPQSLSDAYTRAGVNHILSISGFHIGVIAGGIIVLLLMMLSRVEYLVLRCDIRRFALLVSIPVMIAYLLLTGAAPATARSVVMLCLCAAALCAGRETDPVVILLLSAVILTAWHPPILFDLSFQLSFIALWGIVLAVSPLNEMLSRYSIKPWLRLFLVFLATSLAASLATLVPVLYAFGEASLNGILSNLLVVPILGYGAVLTGFAALVLMPVSIAAAQPFLWCAVQLVEISNRLVMLFAEFPLAGPAAVSERDMALFLLLMVMLTVMKSGRARAAFAVLIPCTAVVLHYAGVNRGDSRLHILMLSVGQAESALIRTPDGGTILVDSGGYLHDTGRDFGRQVLVPALRRMGVCRIDTLILTHDHPDHAGGAEYLLKSMPVGDVWVAGRGISGPLAARSVSLGLPLKVMSAGMSVERPDGVRISVLSPESEPGGSGDSNEDSMVFRLDYRRSSMLFMADVGFETENRLRGTGASVRADVIKLGHHGSRTSTSDPFLDLVSPRIAVLSAGAGNRFGLPSAETVRQMEQRRITLYRTDLEGTIELTSDGFGWRVETPELQRMADRINNGV